MTNFTYEIILQNPTTYTVTAYGRNALGDGLTTTITYRIIGMIGDVVH